MASGSVQVPYGGTAGPLARRLQEYRFPEGYRRMFLSAAYAFAEKGFHGTSTRDIAARAGMSPAALYAFFRSKEDALYQIAIASLDLTSEMLAAESRQAGRPETRIQDMVKILSTWYAHNGPVARVVLYELEALTPEHRAEAVIRKRAIEKILRDAITDGVTTGDFVICDLTAVATTIMSLCVDVARWYRPGGRRTPEAIGEMNADVALRILRAPPNPLRQEAHGSPSSGKLSTGPADR